MASRKPNMRAEPHEQQHSASDNYEYGKSRQRYRKCVAHTLAKRQWLPVFVMHVLRCGWLGIAPLCASFVSACALLISLVPRHTGHVHVAYRAPVIIVVLSGIALAQID
jgi:hypothetical protein